MRQNKINQLNLKIKYNKQSHNRKRSILLSCLWMKLKVNYKSHLQELLPKNRTEELVKKGKEKQLLERNLCRQKSKV
jgi:hypothetical protein